MTSDTNPGGSWDRVAAELRACREAQQRAWGDLDNTTLGRYLAGEVTAEERQQIETALDELPELRKLTELVRDVLGESESPVPEPASVPYGPAILPYPQPKAFAAAGRVAAPLGAPPTVGPSRGWNPRKPVPLYRQRAGLVAAAGLLLALGVALPRSGSLGSAPDESSLAFGSLTASRVEFTSGVALRDNPNEPEFVLMAKAGADSLPQSENALLARVDASVKTLEAEGKREEAKKLVRQYANNMTRQALCCQDQGDLERAEPALDQARRVCARTLGPEAPETVRSRNSLAGVYEVALNTAPVPSYSYFSGTTNFVDPYLAPPGTQPAIPPANNVPMAEPARKVAAANTPSRGMALPYRSSSSYGPSMPAARKPTASAKLAQRCKRMEQAVYDRGHVEAVALRARLTSQSQRKLRLSVVPILTQALREATDPAERQRLIGALGQLGPAAREAVPLLLDRYRKATATAERAAILLSLGQIGPAAQSALPVLVECLHADAVEVRRHAADALVQLGAVARPTIKKLARERPDDDLLQDVLARIEGPEGRSGINDACECFSLKAIQESQQEIQQLATTFRIEIGVETSPDKVVPPKMAKSGQQSVYLHIHKDTSEAQVFVSAALQERGLTDARLRQVLEPPLRKKDFDAVLRQAIEFVARFEREHVVAK